MQATREKKALSENHLHIWQKYRPTKSINYSDIVEDKTIFDETRTDMTFDPNEMTGRSSSWSNNNCLEEPDFDADADRVSVNDIISTSIVDEIYNGRIDQTISQSFVHQVGTGVSESVSVSDILGESSVRHLRQSRQDRTLSLPMNGPGISFSGAASESLLKESFRPSEEVGKFHFFRQCRFYYQSILKILFLVH